jgi:hypothetical protein
MRAVVALVLAAIFVIPPLDLAQARKYCPNGGYCAPGSCAQNGGRYACKAAKCSPKNCKN